MQTHKKFLIWTIWIATIAFIASGPIFSGVGFGSIKSGNVAKVGDVEVSQSQLNMAYTNIYNRYNQMMKGQLDEAKAKEIGLTQQAFQVVVTQAKVLNFAKQNGIIVSDEELANELQSTKMFQEKGTFSRTIYDQFLNSQRLNHRTYEARLRDDMLISKTLELLEVKALPFEVELLTSALNTADKIAYKVLTQNDVTVENNETGVKAYWEMHKAEFMSDKQYKLSIVWTDSANTAVTPKELLEHYNANSFNYTDATGKQLSLEEANASVAKDVKLKLTKIAAQKDYIAFKKNEITANQTLTLSVNDETLTKEIWNELEQKAAGEILKPKTVATRYATVKIDELIQPREKTYEEAHEEAQKRYAAQAAKSALMALADQKLQHFQELNATVSGFISLNQPVNLLPLNEEESLQFIQKLFTSTKEKGMIIIADKIVIYNIVEQKVVSTDENAAEMISQGANKLKKDVFENNLIKMLDSLYPTETYVKGLQN